MTTTSSSGRQGGGERSSSGGRPGFQGGRPGFQGGRPGFQGGRRPGGRPRYYARRKICNFCVDKVKHIDYKDVDRLRRFLSERFKMEGRRRTGVCAKHQRRLVSAIKRARMLAMLPLAQDHRMPAQSWSPRRRPVAAEVSTTEEVAETAESVEAVAAEVSTTEEVAETAESVEAVAIEHDSEDSKEVEEEDQQSSEAVSDKNENEKEKA